MENGEYNTETDKEVGLRNVGVRPGPSAPLDIDAPVEDIPAPMDDTLTPDVSGMEPGADIPDGTL